MDVPITPAPAITTFLGFALILLEDLVVAVVEVEDIFVVVKLECVFLDLFQFGFLLFVLPLLLIRLLILLNVIEEEKRFFEGGGRNDSQINALLKTESTMRIAWLRLMVQISISSIKRFM